MDSTLILNADATPKSIIPISTASWDEAITGIYTGKLTALYTYDDWTVHSQKLEILVPAVCCLSRQVKVKHRFSSEHDGPQNELVFLRDGYVCQYCFKHFSHKHLTVDHIIPKSHGGKRKWNNLVTACAKCNGERGTNTSIQPKIKPVRPTYEYLVKQRRKIPILIPHPTWNYFLGWPDELVKFVKPHKKPKEPGEKQISEKSRRLLGNFDEE